MSARGTQFDRRAFELMDTIDRLAMEDCALFENFLPKGVPHHIQIVVSTPAGRENPFYKLLENSGYKVDRGMFGFTEAQRTCFGEWIMNIPRFRQPISIKRCISQIARIVLLALWV